MRLVSRQPQQWLRPPTAADPTMWQLLLGQLLLVQYVLHTPMTRS